MNEFVKVGPIRYRIVEVEGLVGDQSKLDGHIVYNPSEIRLEISLGSQRRHLVLWHEVIHAILTHGGFDDHDERMVDVLAASIMLVLQDNPWLAGTRSEIVSKPDSVVSTHDLL